MKKIFLAPRSNETSHKNFESTIIGGRSYSFIEPYLTDQEKNVLSKYKTISVWGNKESLRSKWGKMLPEDYVLFYAKGAFYYSARVVLTKFSNDLGSKLWPMDKDGEPWNCLFFVDNLKEINIPIKTVQELAEYEPTWDRVMGFMQLRESGLKAIEEKFGSIENFITQDQKTIDVITNIIETTKEETIDGEKEEIVDKNKLLEEGKGYDPNEEQYKLSNTPHKIRIEKKKQKELVAKLEDYSCQLCGWSLEWTKNNGKKAYRIDIDHIMDKAKGGDERLSNLWALCPNCHAKKTLNVITVDLENGKVYENEKAIKLHHDNHLGW